MSLLVLQHHPHEGPSQLGTMLIRHGHRLRAINLDQGQPLPPDLDDVDGIVILGGAQNVTETDKYPYLRDEMDLIRRSHEAGIPIVGICLGAQLIAAALGGEVAAMDKPECGWATVKLGFPGTVDSVMAGTPWDTVQFHLHGQQVTKLPPGGTPLSGSKLCRTQAFNVGLRTYAFQYHFEWTLEDIRAMVKDPLFAKAGVSPETTLQEADTFYAGYRRLGDRLAQRLSLLLFPVAKRVG